MPPGAHRSQPKVPFTAVLLLLFLLAGIAYLLTAGGGPTGGTAAGGVSSGPAVSGSPSGSTGVSTTPSPQVDAAGVYTPGPIDPSHPGLRTFRGNYSRDYYGQGPVPTHPVVRWRFRRRAACAG